MWWEQGHRVSVRPPGQPPCQCLSVLRDTMDSVKQSAALCLLRLYRTSPDLVPMGDWTSRVVHLLNDQHLVRGCPVPFAEAPPHLRTHPPVLGPTPAPSTALAPPTDPAHRTGPAHPLYLGGPQSGL